MSAPRIAAQRAIIDRRALADTIAALAEEHGNNARLKVLEALRSALAPRRRERRSDGLLGARVSLDRARRNRARERLAARG